MCQRDSASASPTRGRGVLRTRLLNLTRSPSRWKTAEYQIERGQALLLLGRFDEALSAANAAQRLAAQAPQVYLLIGADSDVAS